MDRRTFVQVAALLGFAPWVGHLAYAQAGSAVRIRKDATSAPASADIAAYRTAVAALKSNKNASDYSSWMYWANSHGTPDNIPAAMSKVWYQCQHGTQHFLSWHRAYLFFFETLVREKSGVDNFALPYWNWYASRSIPQSFLDEKLGGQPNSLWHRQRSFRALSLLVAPLRESSIEGFESSLEANPHGTVHVMVGGEMGAVDTSARDPLFWLHHCNIDRMWQVWISSSPDHKNRSANVWLDKPFAFDTGGAKSLKVSALLDTAQQLGYAYDNLQPAGTSVDRVPLRPQGSVEIPLAQGSQISSRTLSSPTAVSRRQGINLTGSSVALSFAMPGAASKRMEIMAAPNASSSLTLVLKDVAATQAGIRRGADYRIYLNLPRAPKDEYRHEDFYLGSINTFALSHRNGAHPHTLTLDLTSKAPQLNKYGLWSKSAVSVSLVSDDDNAEEALIKIGDVQLLMSDMPVR